MVKTMAFKMMHCDEGGWKGFVASGQRAGAFYFLSRCIFERR